MSSDRFPMRILVATDGSGPSDTAIQLAGNLTAATGSELHVLHVTMISQYIHPDLLSEVQVQRIKDEAEARLAAAVARAKEERLEFTNSHIRYGKADEETIRVAQEIGADLIVIGNRSGSAMSRIMLGNDAESIVRHAPCAVLVAREPEV